MFRSKLFIKILIIFAIPVLAILGYNSYTYYENSKVVDEVEEYRKNITFLMNVNNLYNSLEDEKNFILNIDNKNEDDIFEKTNKAFLNFKNLANELSLKNSLEKLDINLENIEKIRTKFHNKQIDTNSLSKVEKVYQDEKERVLNSFFIAKQFRFTNNFYLDISKIISYLNKEDNLAYTKTTISKLIELAQNEFAVYEKEAYLKRASSLIFLIISILTLISILFILQNILEKEENNFNKIKNYKEIYEILSKTNKFLTKTYDEKSLYQNICEILAQNENLKFAFIYDNQNKNIFANSITLKEKILSQMEQYKDENHDNLVSKTIKWQSNIVINSFEDKNLSVFYDESKKLNINSMATFPIKKFKEIDGVLIVYSKVKNFFDKEIEGLFEKLVGDITHCLEKIKYENERINTEDELRLSSYSFDVAEPMIITDTKGNIVKVNQSFCSIMGYEKDEVLGKNPRMFKTAHQDIKFIENMWNNIRIDGFWTGELYNKKANDEIIPLKATINAIKNSQDKTTHYLGQYFDIGKIKDKEKILEYQATHDNLTALPNRLLLVDRIEHAIKKAIRHKIIGGLIFIDLDNFKEVNDKYGHDIGDILLISVAKKMQECLRDEDTVSRVGGDEFVILLDNVGNTKDDARRNIIYLAKKIQDALNGIEQIDGHENIATASIGITLFSDDSVSIKDLIKQADTAMYEAKRLGKNTIEIF